MTIPNVNVRIHGAIRIGYTQVKAIEFDPDVVHASFREDWQRQAIYSVPCCSITFGEGSHDIAPTEDPVSCLFCLGTSYGNP